MIQISGHARFAGDEDGGVLLDIRHDHFFDLNCTGARIWRYAAAGKTVDEIAHLLAEGATSEKSIVEREVNDFIDALARLELIMIDQTSPLGGGH